LVGTTSFKGNIVKKRGTKIVLSEEYFSRRHGAFIEKQIFCKSWRNEIPTVHIFSSGPARYLFNDEFEKSPTTFKSQLEV
jgi:hypothetical protein